MLQQLGGLSSLERKFRRFGGELALKDGAANCHEAHRALYRLAVLPLVAKTLAALAGWLPRFCGQPFQIKVDEDDVPALAAERDALWRRITAAGFLSHAEKRQLLGLRKLRGE